MPIESLVADHAERQQTMSEETGSTLPSSRQTPSRKYRRRPSSAEEVPSYVLHAVYGLGKHKAEERWSVLCLQAFQAGVFKSIACQVYLTVGGGILGAALFPVGLIAILLTGAELFTSDSLFMIVTFLGGKIKPGALLRNLCFSWTFNFVGCLYWALFMTYFPEQLEDAGQVDFAVYFAEKKVNQRWYQIFLKGIGANFLISVAVWQFTTAGEVAGKILAVWFPIVTFMTIGFEHSIANMYFLPIGMWYGAKISVSQLFFKALLPATLGNMLGGGVGMGLICWFLYDSMASGGQLSNKIREVFAYHPIRSKFSRASEEESEDSSVHEEDDIGTH